MDIKAIQNQLHYNDQQALKALYELYGAKLYQLAFAIVKSRELAEEVVEDVFIQAWNKRSRLAGLENLPFYLYTATKNISCSYLRKYSRASKTFSLDEVALPYYQLSKPPEDLMITGETIQLINRAINDLPPKCRLIFKLVKEDGLKYREVADLLHISIKTVENQVGIALKKIHEAIKVHLPSSLFLLQKP